MSAQEAQKIFRQQLTFASLLMSRCIDSSIRVERLANLQGSMLCLHRGLLDYFGAVLGLVEVRGSLVAMRQRLATANYKQEEIIALIDNEESWLFRLDRLVLSIASPSYALSSSHVSKAFASYTAAVDQNSNNSPNSETPYQADDLIVSTSSAHSTNELGWREQKDFIGDCIDSARELLERHIASDIEY
ncbi:hypothetical protein [Agarilytica rhodophyticola]|uniref:hypothetical protein n=1 Tax=Agarilytica rhodophyticola TaxID=1737490 RepID=UPI000B347457|nr:hypothetical protein [Agarilytica rhodophyticola]